MKKLLICGLLVLSGNAYAAGFDCKKAGTSVEKMICANPELSGLDSELNQVFNDARSETAGIDGETGEKLDPVGDEQHTWIKTRNQCADAACLKSAYVARIEVLKQVINR